jgi:hypothetical protein
MAQATFKDRTKDRVAESNIVSVFPTGIFEIVMASIP